MGTASSQEVICIPKHTCLVSTDVDPRLAMVTNRAAGTVDVDATRVDMWSTTSTLYLLPASAIEGVACGPEHDRQVMTMCARFGCDGVLRGRVLLVPKQIAVARAGTMKPRCFRKHRRRFIANPVRQRLSFPAGGAGSTQYIYTEPPVGVDSSARLQWARAPDSTATPVA